MKRKHDRYIQKKTKQSAGGDIGIHPGADHGLGRYGACFCPGARGEETPLSLIATPVFAEEETEMGSRRIVFFRSGTASVFR